jgi:hypothetical protein
VAHYIAAELEAEPRQVGETADEIRVKITQCQLGLFGYAQKGRPAYRILAPMEPLPEALARALSQAATDGSIPCLKLWQIAKEHGLSRHEVGNAADTLGLRIKPCQLGCF